MRRCDIVSIYKPQHESANEQSISEDLDTLQRLASNWHFLLLDGTRCTTAKGSLLGWGSGEILHFRVCTRESVCLSTHDTIFLVRAIYLNPGNKSQLGVAEQAAGRSCRRAEPCRVRGRRLWTLTS